MKEVQLQSGPFTVWVALFQCGYIGDVAPVFKKFKYQKLSDLVGWLSSKFGYCEVIPL